MQLQVWPILLRAKVPTKVLQVKTPLLPVGHPRRPDPPKVLPKILHGAVLKVPPKAQKKASFNSLHLPFLHLPPIFRSWPTINSLSDLIHTCQISMASLGILSGSPLRNFPPLALCSPHLSLIAHLYLFSYLGSSLYVHPPSSPHFFILPLILLPCGQPGAYCPARRLIFQSPLPPSLLLYSAYSFLSPFPRPSPAPSFGPRVFSRCSPNVALPGRSCPTLRPLAMPGYQLVPPMVRSCPRALLLCAAYAAGANYVH